MKKLKVKDYLKMIKTMLNYASDVLNMIDTQQGSEKASVYRCLQEIRDCVNKIEEVSK